jgi:hypothetical protein
MTAVNHAALHAVKHLAAIHAALNANSGSTVTVAGTVAGMMVGGNKTGATGPCFVDAFLMSRHKQVFFPNLFFSLWVFKDNLFSFKNVLEHQKKY